MKKIVLTIVIGIVAALGYSGVASAASCNVQVGNTYYTGAWSSDTVLYNCSGVSGVEVSGNVYHGGTNGMYAFDGPAPGWHGTYTTPSQNLTTLPTYTYTESVNTFGYGCGSQVGTFSVYWQSAYRIRNAFGNTWGSWHLAASPLHVIC